MLYKDLTEVVIECCLEVIRELGSGFLESVYCLSRSRREDFVCVLRFL